MADRQATLKRAGSPTVGDAEQDTGKKQRLGESTDDSAESTSDQVEETGIAHTSHPQDGGSDMPKSIFVASTGGDEKEKKAASDDDETGNDTSSSGSIDFEQWIQVETDAFTDAWDLAEEHRSSVKYLVVKITADLTYDDTQPGSLDNPDIAFDAHRIYGHASRPEFPSISEVFPNVEAFRVQVHVDELLMSLPAEQVHEGHVAQVIKKQVIERLLDGEVTWAREVDLSVKLTWLTGPVSGEQRDASAKDSGQMAYTILTNPGIPFFIGTAPAVTDGSDPSNVSVPE
ncbi:hypothetical protein LTR36_004874 [Oleoguttula mirabilis]|uniref:Uncharacterized protein n=1 Tax=Oleoguttula mirabilis TaxID=1507867 RepID=A0AAV9JH59_9PEZI|nr:hypothetical protein LTR36_004874 [Oleoguttula mirabilis]